MFCPQCEAEYRAEFTTCSDCRIPLVEALPDVPEFEEPDLVEVWETGDPDLLAVAKTVLEAAGIPWFVQGGEAAGMFPIGLGSGTSCGGLAAKLLVPRPLQAEAKLLLETECRPCEGEA